jgi:hypothetical protein
VCACVCVRVYLGDGRIPLSRKRNGKKRAIQKKPTHVVNSCEMRNSMTAFAGKLSSTHLELGGQQRMERPASS